MPKHSYQLINPIIEGTFKDVYDSNEPIEAARDMWKNLTEHIVDHVPRFVFSMRDISSNDIYHFDVTENKEAGTFVINKVDIDIDKKLFTSFEKKIDDYGKSREQHGGSHGGARKRYDLYKEDDSSSSSSSSSSEYYPVIKRTSPIAMFHYNTRVYYTGVTPVRKSTLNPQLIAADVPIFTPIFKPVLGTFVAVWP